MSRTRRGAPAVLAALALALAVPAHRRRGHQARRLDPRRGQGDDHHRDAHRQDQPPRGADDLLLPVRHHDGVRLAHAERRRRQPAPRRSGRPLPSPGSGPTRSTTTASSRTTAPAPRSAATAPSPRPSSRSGSRWPPRPTRCAFGAPSTLAGTLSGTGNAGRPIQLQQKPFPFTTAFANVGNAQLTNAQGGFSFALLSVPLTTQYRVLVTDKPSVVSPVLTVNVTVVVGTRTTRTHVHRGGHVHFSGTVQPKRGQPPDRDPEAQRQEALGDDLGDDHPHRRRLRQDRAHQARRQLPRLRRRQRRHLRSRAPGARSASTRLSVSRPRAPTFGGASPPHARALQAWRRPRAPARAQRDAARG